VEQSRKKSPQLRPLDQTKPANHAHTQNSFSGTATSWSRDLGHLGIALDSLAIQQAAAELRNSGPNAAGSLLAGIVQAASTADFEP